MNKNKFIGIASYFLVLMFFFALSVEVKAQPKKINDKAKKVAAQGDQYFLRKDYGDGELKLC